MIGSLVHCERLYVPFVSNGYGHVERYASMKSHQVGLSSNSVGVLRREAGVALTQKHI